MGRSGRSDEKDIDPQHSGMSDLSIPVSSSCTIFNSQIGFVFRFLGLNPLIFSDAERIFSDFDN